MDTASGQASGVTKPKRKRSGGFPVSPLAMGIAGFLALVALGAMALVLLGIYPPKTAKVPTTVAGMWNASRTATPMAQRASGLTIEKVGPAQKQGNSVTVKLHVTNKVVASAPIAGTPMPNQPTPTAGPAEVYNGTIRVFFYKIENGAEVITGSSIGNVVNLKYGESRDVTVNASSVGDFTDYAAFPDYVWTDKDPVKTGDNAGNGAAPVPSPSTTPNP